MSTALPTPSGALVAPAATHTFLQSNDSSLPLFLSRSPGSLSTKPLPSVALCHIFTRERWQQKIGKDSHTVCPKSADAELVQTGPRPRRCPAQAAAPGPVAYRVSILVTQAAQHEEAATAKSGRKATPAYTLTHPQVEPDSRSVSGQCQR